MSVRRWRLEWLDLGPFYVEGEDLTEEAATLLLRAQWQKIVEAMDSEEWAHNYAGESWEKNAALREVGLECLKFAPRPECCEKSNSPSSEHPLYREPSLQLRAVRVEGYDVVHDPHWTIRTRDFDIEISHCPFCGTELPAVGRLEKPPLPIWTPDDGNCGTCGERNGKFGNCQCNPAEAAYVILKSESVCRVRRAHEAGFITDESIARHLRVLGLEDLTVEQVRLMREVLVNGETK